MNGVVTAASADGFEVQVRQSFGNCPKYIQTRQFDLIDVSPTVPVHQVTSLSASERALIASYQGAERLLRCRPETGYRVEGSLPLRWSKPEFSPFLAQTGPW
jgi:hypothetical protein